MSRMCDWDGGFYIVEDTNANITVANQWRINDDTYVDITMISIRLNDFL